jgi:hypothetical protein
MTEIVNPCSFERTPEEAGPSLSLAARAEALKTITRSLVRGHGEDSGRSRLVDTSSDTSRVIGYVTITGLLLERDGATIRALKILAFGDLGATLEDEEDEEERLAKIEARARLREVESELWEDLYPSGRRLSLAACARVVCAAQEATGTAGDWKKRAAEELREKAEKKQRKADS